MRLHCVCLVMLLGLIQCLPSRDFVLETGDIMIGILLPMHKARQGKNDYRNACGEIWEQYGIHRLEQVFRTIDEINDRMDVLPNIKLGIDVRDSCWSTSVALEQCIDFIRNKLSSIEKAEKLVRNPTTSVDNVFSTTEGLQEVCRQLDVDTRSRVDNEKKPIYALVGPGSSAISVQIQNVLQLFHIPQVGYSATSKELSNKQLYHYFMRVVSSDVLQAKAMVDIITLHNWTYVSTVYTDGSYGKNGMNALLKELEKTSVCKANRDQIVLPVDEYATEQDYDGAVEKLLETPNARVVVCFCQGDTVRELLKSVKRKRKEGHFLFIGRLGLSTVCTMNVNDGWAARPDVVEQAKMAAAGSMSIKLHSPPIKDFDDYFFSLNPYNNKRNVWFNEFWEQRFKCRLPDNMTSRTESSNRTACTMAENLSDGYPGQDGKLGYIVNAIMAVVHGLENMRRDLCPGLKSGLCPEFETVDGGLLRDYIRNVSFTSYSGATIHFDSVGDGPGRYDVMNYQPTSDWNPFETNLTRTYEYVTVGMWENGNLSMDLTKIYWPKFDQRRLLSGRDLLPLGPPIESICSRPCPPGQIKKTQLGGVKCCWDCQPCEENDILIDEMNCQKCSQGWWPDETKTVCQLIEIEYCDFRAQSSIIALIVTGIGILCTLWVLWVVVGARHTPVIRSSSKELLMIALVGILVSYGSVIIVLQKPSMPVCYMQRILPPIGFSLVYGALVTKTNRTWRILSGSKKKVLHRKPRFLSSSAQVVITCILTGLQIVVITGTLIYEPADSVMVYPLPKRSVLLCNTSKYGHLIPMGFAFLLMALCTLYAMRTRKLKCNFNEPRYLGICMYGTCAVWTIGIPVYYGDDIPQVLAWCYSIVLSASLVLALVFGPKVYVIIWKPEKNTVQHFGGYTANIGRSESYDPHLIGDLSFLDNDPAAVERIQAIRRAASQVKQEALSRVSQDASSNQSLIAQRLRRKSMALIGDTRLADKILMEDHHRNGPLVPRTSAPRRNQVANSPISEEETDEGQPDERTTSPNPMGPLPALPPPLTPELIASIVSAASPHQPNAREEEPSSDSTRIKVMDSECQTDSDAVLAAGSTSLQNLEPLNDNRYQKQLRQRRPLGLQPPPSSAPALSVNNAGHKRKSSIPLESASPTDERPLLDQKTTQADSSFEEVFIDLSAPASATSTYRRSPAPQKVTFLNDTGHNNTLCSISTQGTLLNPSSTADLRKSPTLPCSVGRGPSNSAVNQLQLSNSASSPPQPRQLDSAATNNDTPMFISVTSLSSGGTTEDLGAYCYEENPASGLQLLEQEELDVERLKQLFKVKGINLDITEIHSADV